MAMNELITKINRIFEGLMGCQMEFQPAETLSQDLWSKHDIDAFSLEGDRPTYIESEALGYFGFPVSLHGSFAGLAVVKDWKGQNRLELLHLAELFSLLLENGFAQSELQDRRERLRLIEERMVLSEETGKVVPFRSNRVSKKGLESNDDFPEINFEFSAPRQPKPVTNLPLLILAKAGFPLQRLATEVHQKSERWAMVSMEDLPAEVFESRESLKELGSITLFIKDVSTLTTEQQVKLAEYLATKPSSEMPHVIAGLDENEDGSTSQVLPHLLKQFCVSKLQWTEKTQEEMNHDTLNASLLQLLERSHEVPQENPQNLIPFHIKYHDPNPPVMH